MSDETNQSPDEKYPPLLCMCPRCGWSRLDANAEIREIARQLAEAQRTIREHAEEGCAEQIDGLKRMIGDRDRQLAAVERERDLAIAHDRQPYPTADADERVCVLLTAAKERERKWSLALQSLTPGGSEYVDDPARCVAFVRETRESQHQQILGLVKQKKTSEAL